VSQEGKEKMASRHIIHCALSHQNGTLNLAIKGFVANYKGVIEQDKLAVWWPSDD